MVGRECLTLAEAVRLALEQSGDEALARPSLLLGFLMDYANQDSVELRALERNLDDGLLFSFREELARPEPDLCVAATRASTYLVDECVVREGEAKLVAEGIAEGVARWRGLDYVCDDWLKGESKDDLADDLADDLGTNEPDDPGPQLFHKKAQSVVTSLRHRALPDSFAAICAAVIIVVAVVTVALAAFAVRQRAQQSVASGLDPGQVAEEVGWDIEGPRSKPDSSMASGRVVMWDCVWFGSYPQREITPSYAVFESLETAKWDDNGDARVNGARYHRISRDDATHDKYWLDDGPAYRYFLWEPIKWRVLKVSGSRALVLADVALDARQYNAEYDDVTWETSSVRSWLNGYGADANQPNADYSRKGFCDVAFTESQREAILSTNVKNRDNVKYGTSGGKDTDDEVFLLGESEVYGSGGEKHGFAEDSEAFDEARRCGASDYASAMGAWRSTDGGLENNCWWWLRSPGDNAGSAADAYADGHVYRKGIDVGSRDAGIRPALTLDLKSTAVTYADTVSSDESG